MRYEMKVFFAAVSMIAMCISSAQARQLTGSEKAAVEEAVKGQLKDPFSAKFKWPDYINEESRIYCGYVNAKNSYGGYIGYTMFYVFIARPEGTISGKTEAVLMELGDSDPNSVKSQLVETMCTSYGY
jgi:hypothetical protein